MRVPLVMQAPIGPAATPDLVAGVAHAGGLGCLAASWTPPEVLRAQVEEVRRAVEAPFCVNLVLAFDQEERVELLVEAGVPAISFSWGIDEPALRRARDAGITVLVQVATVEAGERAATAGADILIAQGVEAGGHVQSRAPVHRLVRDLRRGLSLPILAAGGIADSSSASAALRAGASGVVAGTAYLAAREADVHPTYRDRLYGARRTETCLTTLFDVGWPHAPHRVLRNRTLDQWEAAGSPPAGSRPGEGEPVATRGDRTVVRYSDAQPTRDTRGDVAAMALYAGLGVEQVRETDDAAAITERLLAAGTG